MQLARPAFAPHPSVFGRGRIFDLRDTAVSTPAISADLKLFLSTFAVGFVFVSVLIG
jgi:hypothetical protein